VSMMDGELSAKAKFNIDRTEWNLSYGDEANAVDKAKDKFIYNTVNIGLEVTASKVQL
jgi:accessory colonization factor AcfC